MTIKWMELHIHIKMYLLSIFGLLSDCYYAGALYISCYLNLVAVKMWKVTKPIFTHIAHWIQCPFLKVACCSVFKSCPTLHNPMDYSMSGFPVHHHLLEFAQVAVICLGPAWGTPPMAKVMRKEAWHTQRRDQASGNPCSRASTPKPESVLCSLP